MSAAEKARGPRIPLISGVTKTTRTVYEFGGRGYLTRNGAEMAAARRHAKSELDPECAISREDLDQAVRESFRLLRQESDNG